MRSCPIWKFGIKGDSHQCQCHIMDKRRTDKGREALMKLHQSLRSGLILQNILPALRPLLTDVEYCQVDGKTDNVAQVDEFIRILLTKEFRHFETFCAVLASNGYEDWAKTLREEVREEVDISSEESPKAYYGSTTVRLEPMEVKLQVISSVLLGKKIYISGIAVDDEPKSCQVQTFSLDEGKWSTLCAAPTHNATVAVIKGHITLIGGRDANIGLPSGILSKWVEKELKWDIMQISVPANRVASTIYHHDNLLLVSGGAQKTAGGSTRMNVANTVYVYNFTTGQWSTPEALKLPQALRSHHMVAFQENIYLMGGATTFPVLQEKGQSQYNAQVWRAQWRDIQKVVSEVEACQIVWTELATPPPALRPTVISCEHSLMAVGGVKEGKPQEAIYEYVDGDVVDGKVNNSWRPVGNMSVGRYRHAVVPLGSRGAVLFVAGGYVQGSLQEDEVNVKCASAEFVFL